MNTDTKSFCLQNGGGIKGLTRIILAAIKEAFTYIKTMHK
jgi:hypothetical protein